MSNSIFKTYGTITKKEKLASVENQTNTNVLILETFAPFPGYHGSTVPDSLEPDSLFVITKVSHNEDFLQRAIQAVKKTLSLDVDAAPASLNIQNENRSAIRLKGVKYTYAGEIISEFQKQGIVFRKAKKVSSYETLIKVFKFFDFEQIEKNYYSDCTEKNMGYFTIPSLLRWSSFEKMTMSCKYNCTDKNFDAAIATVYLENNIVDMVRIYDRHGSLDKLKDIRKKYIDAFSKF